MLKLRELKNWINSLPTEFLEYNVVSSNETVLDGDYTLREDKPIIELNVDEETQEILILTK